MSESEILQLGSQQREESGRSEVEAFHKTSKNGKEDRPPFLVGLLFGDRNRNREEMMVMLMMVMSTCKTRKG